MYNTFFYLFNILNLQYEAVYHGRGYLTYTVVNSTVTFKYETPTICYNCFWTEGPKPSMYFNFDVDELVNNPADSINNFEEKQKENGIENLVCIRTNQQPSKTKLDQLNEKQEGLTVKKIWIQYKRDLSPQGIISFNRETQPGIFWQLNLKTAHKCELNNYNEVVDSMKFSLWPAGIRIPQKYNVHTHDGCEEYQGEYFLTDEIIKEVTTSLESEKPQSAPEEILMKIFKVLNITQF